MAKRGRPKIGDNELIAEISNEVFCALRNINQFTEDPESCYNENFVADLSNITYYFLLEPHDRDIMVKQRRYAKDGQVLDVKRVRYRSVAYDRIVRAVLKALVAKNVIPKDSVYVTKSESVSF